MTTPASDVIFSPAGAGAVDRTAQEKLRDTINALDYGAVQDGSTQTAVIQTALDALPANGLLHIPRDVKFSLADLDFPQNCNIDFRVDDCNDTPNQGSKRESGERVLFSCNSSYPTNVNGGLVNEWRFTSGLNSGVMVDTWTDLPGMAPYFGPGQSATNPVRASYNMAIDQVGYHYEVIVRYPTFSNFSGWSSHTWRETVALNGVGTSAWASLPPENTLITGATSGATGLLLSVDAGSTTVLWMSGRFVVGEGLTDNDETTSATVSSISKGTAAMPPLSQDFKRGNFSIGLPPGAPRHLFAVGGKIAATKTRNFGQHVDQTVINPAFVLVDDYEAVTQNGFELTYDVAPAAASRRLTLRKLGQTADIGHIGAVRAYTNFANTVLNPGSAFNIASIVRNAVGDYIITFTTPFVTADYTVSLANSDILDTSRVFNVSANTVRIFNYLTGTTTKADLIGRVHVSCLGGDR